MDSEKEKIAKKTLYLFKKYARQNNFWEEYKKLSTPLNRLKNPLSFKQVVLNYEPIQLIQNAEAFCHWPNSITDWGRMSARWAKICIEEGLYYNSQLCYTYFMYHINKGFIKSDELIELKKILKH